MFKNKQNPTMNELIKWFQVTQPKLTKDMESCTHHYKDSINPYHIEGQIWTHLMMVCKVAELYNATKINKIVALLHDIGKPKSLEIDNEKQRTFFKGHEGISFWLAIEILNNLQKEIELSDEEKSEILNAISLHGTLFNHIKDGMEYKPEKLVSKFRDIEDYYTLVNQVKYDSLGRFGDEFSKKEDTLRLGKDIFNEDTFLKYTSNEPIINKSKNITLLTGLPSSGKSTYIKNNIKDEVVISRDNTMMDYISKIDDNMNYNQAWKYLTENDLHKEIDKLVQKKFQKAVKDRENIIIDMTNLSIKSRRKWLHSIPKDYHKKSIIFCTSLEIIKQRASERKGKFIHDNVYLGMMRSFTVPCYDEFDEILWEF